MYAVTVSCLFKILRHTRGNEGGHTNKKGDVGSCAALRSLLPPPSSSGQPFSASCATTASGLHRLTCPKDGEACSEIAHLYLSYPKCFPQPNCALTDWVA